MEGHEAGPLRRTRQRRHPTLTVTIRTQVTEVTRKQCPRCRRQPGEKHKDWCKGKGSRRKKRTLHRGDPIILEIRDGLAVPTIHIANAELDGGRPLIGWSECGQAGYVYCYTDVFRHVAVCVDCWRS